MDDEDDILASILNDEEHLDESETGRIINEHTNDVHNAKHENQDLEDAIKDKNDHLPHGKALGTDDETSTQTDNDVNVRLLKYRNTDGNIADRKQIREPQSIEKHTSKPEGEIKHNVGVQDAQRIARLNALRSLALLSQTPAPGRTPNVPSSTSTNISSESTAMGGSVHPISLRSEHDVAYNRRDKHYRYQGNQSPREIRGSSHLDRHHQHRLHYSETTRSMQASHADTSHHDDFYKDSRFHRNTQSGSTHENRPHQIASEYGKTPRVSDMRNGQSKPRSSENTTSSSVRKSRNLKNPVPVSDGGQIRTPSDLASRTATAQKSANYRHHRQIKNKKLRGDKQHHRESGEHPFKVSSERDPVLDRRKRVRENASKTEISNSSHAASKSRHKHQRKRTSDRVVTFV